jgi:hypothetical protein
MAAMRARLRAPATASRLPWSPLSIDRDFQTVILACGLGLTAQVGFLIHPDRQSRDADERRGGGVMPCGCTASMSATWP